MSEEKYMKSFNGEKIFCLEYDKETLKDMVLDLQQRVEQLEEENKRLEQYYDFYVDLTEKQNITLKARQSGKSDLFGKIANEYNELKIDFEQLENIRKEAIQLINERAYWAEETEDGDFISGKCLTDDDIDDLFNILNKGSESNE